MKTIMEMFLGLFSIFGFRIFLQFTEFFKYLERKRTDSGNRSIILFFDWIIDS